MTTPSQHLTSRLNGSLSKGPKTPEGRRISSRNATKHGLSGNGKNLPPDMETELQSEIALYSPITPARRLRARPHPPSRPRKPPLPPHLRHPQRPHRRPRPQRHPPLGRSPSRRNRIARLTTFPTTTNIPRTPPPHRRRLRLPRRRLGIPRRDPRNSGLLERNRNHPSPPAPRPNSPPKLNDPTALADLYRLIISLRFKHNNPDRPNPLPSTTPTASPSPTSPPPTKPSQPSSNSHPSASPTSNPKPKPSGPPTTSPPASPPPPEPPSTPPPNSPS